jgi:hypothetical protein
MRMIRTYGGKSLSAVSRELWFAVSTVNSIMKDDGYIKEHVNFIFDVIHVCLYISFVFNMSIL